jgi:hypothetical protein
MARAQPLIARELSEKKWAEVRRWACVLLYFHVLSPLCEFYLLGTRGRMAKGSLQRATIARTAAGKRSKMYAAIV